jgi:hypothetical protein
MKEMTEDKLITISSTLSLTTDADLKVMKVVNELHQEYFPGSPPLTNTRCHGHFRVNLKSRFSKKGMSNRLLTPFHEVFLKDAYQVIKTNKKDKGGVEGLRAKWKNLRDHIYHDKHEGEFLYDCFYSA